MIKKHLIPYKNIEKRLNYIKNMNNTIMYSYRYFKELPYNIMLNTYDRYKIKINKNRQIKYNIVKNFKELPNIY